MSRLHPNKLCRRLQDGLTGEVIAAAFFLVQNVLHGQNDVTAEATTVSDSTIAANKKR
jgi:hypothetical protein